MHFVYERREPGEKVLLSIYQGEIKGKMSTRRAPIGTPALLPIKEAHSRVESLLATSRSKRLPASWDVVNRHLFSPAELRTIEQKIANHNRLIESAPASRRR